MEQTYFVMSWYLNDLVSVCHVTGSSLEKQTHSKCWSCKLSQSSTCMCITSSDVRHIWPIFNSVSKSAEEEVSSQNIFAYKFFPFLQNHDLLKLCLHLRNKYHLIKTGIHSLMFIILIVIFVNLYFLISSDLATFIMFFWESI